MLMYLLRKFLSSTLFNLWSGILAATLIFYINLNNIVNTLTILRWKKLVHLLALARNAHVKQQQCACFQTNVGLPDSADLHLLIYHTVGKITFFRR